MEQNQLSFGDSKTYTISLSDKAAFLNRLKAQKIQVTSSDIVDNNLNKTFTLTLHNPESVKIADQLLKQSKDIEDNPSTKLPPLDNKKLNELKNLIRKEFKKVINEIKIQPNTGGFVSFNNKLLNKTTGNESKITKISWNEALQSKIFSGITLKYLNTIFIDILGIIPSKVYIENNPSFTRPGLYVKGDYHGNEIMYVKKTSKNGGQDPIPILYSKYAKIFITQWIKYGEISKNKWGKDENGRDYMINPAQKAEFNKENLLKQLKIEK